MGTKPNVWEMPTTGIEWCDCGEHCKVTRQLVENSIMETLGTIPSPFITHTEICETLMDLWNYVEVCEFFHDKVKQSAETMHGSVAEKYPTETAYEIIAHFSKTWQGCPEEACTGGYDAIGPQD